MVSFLANKQVNPNEHCKVITTKSGIVVGEGSGDNLVAEKVIKDETEEEKNKMEEEKNKIEEEKNKGKGKEKKSENKERDVPLRDLPY